MTKDKLTPSEHAALWDNFRNGSKEAFSQLYELFAADLNSKLGPTDNIRFYMYRSLRRRLTDSITKLNKFDSDDYVFDNAEFMIEPRESQMIEEQTLERQKQMVIAELNKLPKRQKEILYLVYMKGFTYQEAAEAMDITMKSVYNTVNVALTTLKGYLKDTFKKQGLLLVLLFLQYFFKN
eukprot:gene19821-25768_t